MSQPQHQIEVCSECDEKADWYCVQDDSNFCNEHNLVVHAPKALKNHERVPIGEKQNNMKPSNCQNHHMPLCLYCVTCKHPVKSVVDVVDDVKTELKQQIKKLRPVAIACEVEAETLEKIIQDINDSEARSGESIEKEFGHLVNLLSTTKKRLREELKRKSQICRDNVHSRQEKLNNVKSSLNRGLREAEHTFSSQAIAQTIASAGCVVEAPNRISMKTSSLALNTWIPVASMSSARRHHTATLLSSGKVLVAGGHSSNSLSSCEVNDPPSNRWTPVASMSSPRFWHTATLLSSGKLLVTGGYTDSNSLSSCEVYDRPSNTWTPVASMSSAHGYHTATLLSSGKVLVTGGDGHLSSCEVYDPPSNTWTPVASMSSAHGYHTATLLSSGKVLVTGGDGRLSSCEMYDPPSNRWTPVASMSSAHGYHTATLLSSGKVLVTGGGGDGPSSSCEVYDW
ncbi:unnamed protein product [Didymodactylos carnosus]|uniref:B box-type domain-containing protein n=1 Tax=Didymodactylos carnosus TaxID=1234261 RepID=A0A815F9Q9_9BILA|nr:unnamed protein product [Didymodactylos carnosus]CAF4168898.1 unnamed protein product [Didymodactylos carnosus]